MLPVPGELGGQPTPLERAPVMVEGDRAGPALPPGDVMRNQEEEEEDEADEDVNIEVRWWNSFCI